MDCKSSTFWKVSPSTLNPKLKAYNRLGDLDVRRGSWPNKIRRLVSEKDSTLFPLKSVIPMKKKIESTVPDELVSMDFCMLVITRMMEEEPTSGW